ncbi:hypothetical protein AVEN_45199-1 [Araneus ventricosus]|uniref:Uncharacterized protein n=1 Tax=Araneus ventricosus TaxID=182803 RepID=A0A4Y2N594_ARAVE|nr:hypothetical protein AVEN_45199-1 [Araneus ventricosus]
MSALTMNFCWRFSGFSCKRNTNVAQFPLKVLQEGNPPSVAVFRTGVKGACLLSGDHGGHYHQNLFDVHLTDKPTANLHHIVLRGVSKPFKPVSSYYQNPPMPLNI